MSFTGAPAYVEQEHPAVSLTPNRARSANGHGRIRQEPRARPNGTIPPELGLATFDSPGLLLLDISFRPLYANEEAVRILCYPDTPNGSKGLSLLLANRIDSVLPKHNGSLYARFSNELDSGRRRYQVRVFTLKSHTGNGHGPAIAILLERTGRATMDLSRIREKFRLTRREAEALELLMQGDSTKEIADCMGVSPNTAKTFLRSVMFKTGSCDRAGILAKILQISTGAAEQSRQSSGF